jgi:hypothetical protein
LAVEVLEDRALLSTFVVDRLTDTGAGSGLTGDLRYCITNAVDKDKITFDDSVTGTIKLTGALPDLNHSVSIEGPGAGSLTVQRDTGGYYRIFKVNDGTTVSIAGLTITNGNAAAGSILIGGEILNEGTLTLNNVTVSGNRASYGGGIDNNGGTLTVENATVSGNFAAEGAGIYNNDSGTLLVKDTTVSGNEAYDGGGIENSGTLTLKNSTVSGNTTESDASIDGGGGILNDGTLTLNNSTVSGNSTGEFGPNGGIGNYGTLTLNNSTVSGNSTGGCGEAGGIGNHGTLTLNNCTISGNSDDAGAGGILNASGSTLNARNTIIAGNGTGDLYGSLSSSGYNLIGNSSGGSGYADTDLLDVAAKLGSLQDNGGPTKTIALLAGSPALNAGDSAQLGTKDQRGVVRSGGVNIGAYQASASAFVLTAPTTTTAGTAFNVTVKAVDTFGQTAVGYTGTVHFSSSDGQAVLPANYTFTGTDAGLHTFSNGVTLKTAGTRTVTATDTVTSSITGSASVTVNPAAADHLLFLQQPTDTAAGQTITPAVTVEVVDQFGNVVTSDNSHTVTLAIGTNPSGGTLSGTLTVTVVNGVATFSDLFIDLAGNGYTLHAMTTGLADADSSAFRITA